MRENSGGKSIFKKLRGKYHANQTLNCKRSLRTRAIKPVNLVCLSGYNNTRLSNTYQDVPIFFLPFHPNGRGRIKLISCKLS